MTNLREMSNKLKIKLKHKTVKQKNATKNMTALAFLYDSNM